MKKVRNACASTKKRNSFIIVTAAIMGVLIAGVAVADQLQTTGKSKIQGYVYFDANNNGVMDPGEPGLAGWTVSISLGTARSTAITDANGFYSFTNLDPGRYFVSEVVKSAWQLGKNNRNIYIIDLNSGENVEQDFANVPSGSHHVITGSKINDTNSDGMIGQGEVGVPGWKITLKNSATNSVIDSTVTTSSGFYYFMVTSGKYIVTEEARTGWAPTAPTSRAVTVDGGDVTGINFTNVRLFNISGYKIQDTNLNGTWDAGEPGIPGWNITLSKGGAVLSVISTDSNGYYRFMNIPTGNYIVTEEDRAGWGHTGPTSMAVNLVDQDITNVNFTNIRLHSISGYKINDKNRNGLWDPGETGIPGWNITLSNAGVAISTIATDSNGQYQFSNLLPGNYVVTEEDRAGWDHTSPASKAIILADKDMTNVNFTNAITPVTPKSTIEVLKFNDTLSPDGIQDLGEEPLAGWEIKVSNGASTVTEVTGIDGRATFQNLAPGSYKVCETLQPGWANSVTPVCTDVKNLASGAVVEVIFANKLVSGGVIEGFKFNDSNCNKIWDNSEQALEGWKIVLSGFDMAAMLPVNAAAITDINGHYAFSGLNRGVYTVREAFPLKPNWQATLNAGGVSVTLDTGGYRRVDFGNMQSPSTGGATCNLR